MVPVGYVCSCGRWALTARAVSREPTPEASVAVSVLRELAAHLRGIGSDSGDLVVDLYGSAMEHAAADIDRLIREAEGETT